MNQLYNIHPCYTSTITELLFNHSRNQFQIIKSLFSPHIVLSTHVPQFLQHVPLLIEMYYYRQISKMESMCIVAKYINYIEALHSGCGAGFND